MTNSLETYNNWIEKSVTTIITNPIDPVRYLTVAEYACYDLRFELEIISNAYFNFKDIIIETKPIHEYKLTIWHNDVQCNIAKLDKIRLTAKRSDIMITMNVGNGCKFTEMKLDEVIEVIESAITLYSSSSLPVTVSHICAKCKQYDEYASPSDKHSGEVRCYKCCG